MKKTLAEIEERATVRVHFLHCGHGIKNRLCSMGLGSGETVEIVKNDHSGPVIIKVLDTKLAIGRGQAEQILVDYE